MAVLLVPKPGFAEENRVSRLAGSHLIKSLERDGNWTAEVSASRIEYTCLKCGGKVEAIVEVISPYTSENHASLGQRFLAERKLLCAQLTTLGTGRCVRTDPTGMRGGALTGFRSDIEMTGRKEIEIAFFYHEEGLDPELIRATVVIESGAVLPQNSIEMFRWHMARLTNPW